MGKEEILIALENQVKYFTAGNTLKIKSRLKVLKELRNRIIENEEEIKNALWLDFHKPAFEATATETRFVVKELNLAIRRLRKWSGGRRVWTPLVHFLANSYIKPQPYGQVLVLSPWNFPFQLALMPLIGAIAAGNCVVLKVSRQVPNVTSAMEKILNHFPKELIIMINGDHEISEYLLMYYVLCIIGKKTQRKFV